MQGALCFPTEKTKWAIHFGTLAQTFSENIYLLAIEQLAEY